jgi:hypothetical protein
MLDPPGRKIGTIGNLGVHRKAEFSAIAPKELD